MTPSLILLPSIPKPHLFLHWPGLLISIWLDCLLVTWVKTYEQSWKEYSYIFSDLSNCSMRYFFQEEKLREPGILISSFLFTRSAQNDRNYKPLLDSSWCNSCWAFFRAILLVLLRMHCWFTDSSSSCCRSFCLKLQKSSTCTVDVPLSAMRTCSYCFVSCCSIRECNDGISQLSSSAYWESIQVIRVEPFRTDFNLST